MSASKFFEDRPALLAAIAALKPGDLCSLRHQAGDGRDADTIAPATVVKVDRRWNGTITVELVGHSETFSMMFDLQGNRRRKPGETDWQLRPATVEQLAQKEAADKAEADRVAAEDARLDAVMAERERLKAAAPSAEALAGIVVALVADMETAQGGASEALTLAAKGVKTFSSNGRVRVGILDEFAVVRARLSSTAFTLAEIEVAGRCAESLGEALALARALDLAVAVARWLDANLNAPKAASVAEAPETDVSPAVLAQVEAPAFDDRIERALRGENPEAIALGARLVEALREVPAGLCAATLLEKFEAEPDDLRAAALPLEVAGRIRRDTDSMGRGPTWRLSTEAEFAAVQARLAQRRAEKTPLEASAPRASAERLPEGVNRRPKAEASAVVAEVSASLERTPFQENLILAARRRACPSTLDELLDEAYPGRSLKESLACRKQFVALAADGTFKLWRTDEAGQDVFALAAIAPSTFKTETLAAAPSSVAGDDLADRLVVELGRFPDGQEESVLAEALERPVAAVALALDQLWVADRVAPALADADGPVLWRLRRSGGDEPKGPSKLEDFRFVEIKRSASKRFEVRAPRCSMAGRSKRSPEEILEDKNLAELKRNEKAAEREEKAAAKAARAKATKIKSRLRLEDESEATPSKPSEVSPLTVTREAAAILAATANWFLDEDGVVNALAKDGFSDAKLVKRVLAQLIADKYLERRNGGLFATVSGEAYRGFLETSGRIVEDGEPANVVEMAVTPPEDSVASESDLDAEPEQSEDCSPDSRVWSADRLSIGDALAVLGKADAEVLGDWFDSRSDEAFLTDRDALAAELEAMVADGVLKRVKGSNSEAPARYRNLSESEAMRRRVRVGPVEPERSSPDSRLTRAPALEEAPSESPTEKRALDAATLWSKRLGEFLGGSSSIFHAPELACHRIKLDAWQDGWASLVRISLDTVPVWEVSRDARDVEGRVRPIETARVTPKEAAELAVLQLFAARVARDLEPFEVGARDKGLAAEIATLEVEPLPKRILARLRSLWPSSQTPEALADDVGARPSQAFASAFEKVIGRLVAAGLVLKVELRDGAHLTASSGGSNKAAGVEFADRTPSDSVKLVVEYPGGRRRVSDLKREAAESGVPIWTASQSASRDPRATRREPSFQNMPRDPASYKTGADLDGLQAEREAGDALVVSRLKEFGRAGMGVSFDTLAAEPMTEARAKASIQRLVDSGRVCAIGQSGQVFDLRPSLWERQSEASSTFSPEERKIVDAHDERRFRQDVIECFRRRNNAATKVDILEQLRKEFPSYSFANLDHLENQSKDFDAMVAEGALRESAFSFGVGEARLFEPNAQTLEDFDRARRRVSDAQARGDDGEEPGVEMDEVAELSTDKRVDWFKAGEARRLELKSAASRRAELFNLENRIITRIQVTETSVRELTEGLRRLEIDCARVLRADDEARRKLALDARTEPSGDGSSENGPSAKVRLEGMTEREVVFARRLRMMDGFSAAGEPDIDIDLRDAPGQSGDREVLLYFGGGRVAVPGVVIYSQGSPLRAPALVSSRLNFVHYAPEAARALAKLLEFGADIADALDEMSETERAE